MKTTKEILENLVDALIEAEPVLHDDIRVALARANAKLYEVEALAEEFASEAPQLATHNS